MCDIFTARGMSYSHIWILWSLLSSFIITRPKPGNNFGVFSRSRLVAPQALISDWIFRKTPKPGRTMVSGDIFSWGQASHAAAEWESGPRDAWRFTHCWDNSFRVIFAHLSPPWSIGWVALSFLVRRLFVRRPAMVTSNQISIFFNIYRHKSPILTQFHLIPSSTKLYWPSTTKYQPVPPHTDPAPPNTNHYRLLLTQYYHVSTSSAS